MSKARKIYIDYYNLSETMVDESTEKFFEHLEKVLLKDVMSFDGKLYHVTLTPERWKLFSDFETRYQLKKEADRKAQEVEAKLKLMEEQVKALPQKLEEKESFDFRELEVIV